MKSLGVKILICAILCLTAGIASGLGTAGEIASWYVNINKPSWNPPNWLFGPVWTILYIMMGVAVALVWHAGKNNKKAIILFTVQFALNLCWSFIFFGLHQIGIAFIEIIIMWGFIVATIFAFSKINTKAAWLLVPYVSWVTFASILNGIIWFLN